MFRRYQDQSEVRHLFIAERFLCAGIDGIAAYRDRDRRIIVLFFIGVQYAPEDNRTDEIFFEQHWDTMKRSLFSHHYMKHYTRQISYLHIYDQTTFGLSFPIRRMTVGEGLEYIIHDILLSVLDDRFTHSI